MIRGTPTIAPITVIQSTAPNKINTVPIIPATSLPVSPSIPVISFQSAAKGCIMGVVMV